MNADTITHLILMYRYPMLILLAFIEGPIVSFAAGTLAAAGYFDVYILAAIFLSRDIFMDIVFYAIGYYGTKTSFVKRMLSNIHVREGHLEEVHRLWLKRPFRTMSVSKLSYGIAPVLIIIAGLVRYSIFNFVIYGSLVAVLEYGTLLGLGYFLGRRLSAGTVSWLNNIQYGIAAFALVLAVYYGITIYMRHRAMQEVYEQDKRN